MLYFWKVFVNIDESLGLEDCTLTLKLVIISQDFEKKPRKHAKLRNGEYRDAVTFYNVRNLPQA